MIPHGHRDAWSEWRRALGGSRMHHAWILAGKRGLGKSEFAYRAARELVAEPGMAQPSGDHPDIISLTHLPATKDDEKKRDEGKPYEVKRNIAIGQIRSLQQRLTTRPTLGARRAIIIDPADDLEKPASNALLKSLEEPPVGSFFLLVTHRPGRLLPTIRSRCRILRFPELSPSEMEQALADKAGAHDPAVISSAIEASGGSPGVALEFIQHDLAPLHALMVRIAREGDPDFVLRGELAETIGLRPDRDRMRASIELARSVIAGHLGDGGRANLPHIIDAYGELGRIAAQAPTYNFDPGLLVMEIGGLLATAAMDREPANG